MTSEEFMARAEEAHGILLQKCLDNGKLKLDYMTYPDGHIVWSMMANVSGTYVRLETFDSRSEVPMSSL